MKRSDRRSTTAHRSAAGRIVSVGVATSERLARRSGRVRRIVTVIVGSAAVRGVLDRRRSTSRTDEDRVGSRVRTRRGRHPENVKGRLRGAALRSVKRSVRSDYLHLAGRNSAGVVVLPAPRAREPLDRLAAVEHEVDDRGVRVGTDTGKRYGVRCVVVIGAGGKTAPDTYSGSF